MIPFLISQPFPCCTGVVCAYRPQAWDMPNRVFSICITASAAGFALDKWFPETRFSTDKCVTQWTSIFWCCSVILWTRCLKSKLSNTNFLPLSPGITIDCWDWPSVTRGGELAPDGASVSAWWCFWSRAVSSFTFFSTDAAYSLPNSSSLR